MVAKGGASSGHRALARWADHKNPCPDGGGREGRRLHPQSGLSPGNEADIAAAPALLGKCPAPRRLLADRGYDAGSLRYRLAATQTEAVIPSTRSRKSPIPYDANAYRARNLIERAFCRLKDWRRIATRYDKLAINLASTVAIAVIILGWTD